MQGGGRGRKKANYDSVDTDKPFVCDRKFNHRYNYKWLFFLLLVYYEYIILSFETYFK